MRLKGPLLFQVSQDDAASLIGRASEVKHLDSVLEALAGGRGAVVEISGEPGIGKTALPGVLASRAEAMGVRVARAHALHGIKMPRQLRRRAAGLFCLSFLRERDPFTRQPEVDPQVLSIAPADVVESDQPLSTASS